MATFLGAPPFLSPRAILAEKILLLNPELAIKQGNLIDCTGRLYKGISALQYSVWALDYYMWSMILPHINNANLEEVARTQLRELPGLNEKGFITEEINNRWPSLGWHQLIDAYNKYLKEGLITKVWKEQVGGAQLLLPAHVINKYSRPTLNMFRHHNRKWGSNVPRTGVIDWKTAEKGNHIENGKYTLGKDFAWLRGDDDYQARAAELCIYPLSTVQRANEDVRAVAELMKARVEQARMLLSPQRSPKLPTLSLLKQQF